MNKFLLKIILSQMIMTVIFTTPSWLEYKLHMNSDMNFTIHIELTLKIEVNLTHAFYL